MAKTKKQQPPDSKVGIVGAYRLTINNQDGTVAGDSGWQKNAIVTNGLQNYLANRLINAASSVTHVAIGVGTAPAASTTALPSELNSGTVRVAIGNTGTTANASTATVSMATAFASGNSDRTGNISNIGLYGSTSGSNLFAGATYNSSPLSSTQAVNVSYTISLTAA